MNRGRIAFVGAFLAVIALGVLLAFPPLALVSVGEYDTATVTVVDENGTTLATVDVRLADTPDKRRVGLMRTDTLATGSGMLFVHPREGTYTYHMRNMAFDIDMVFVAANGTVTTVHHASAPENDESTDRYTGRGQYVLEVPRGYANATGIDTGDRVLVPNLSSPGED